MLVYSADKIKQKKKVERGKFPGEKLIEHKRTASCYLYQVAQFDFFPPAFFGVQCSEKSR